MHRAKSNLTSLGVHAARPHQSKPDRNGSLRFFIGATVYGRTEAHLRTTGLAFQKKQITQ